MDNRTRAGKIHDFLIGKCARLDTRFCANMQFIISQFDEAVREERILCQRQINVAHKIVEGVEKVNKHILDVGQEGFEKGFAAGREKAAKIAEADFWVVRGRLAERIRAMDADK